MTRRGSLGATKERRDVRRKERQQEEREGE